MTWETQETVVSPKLSGPLPLQEAPHQRKLLVCYINGACSLYTWPSIFLVTMKIKTPAEEACTDSLWKAALVLTEQPERERLVLPREGSWLKEPLLRPWPFLSHKPHFHWKVTWTNYVESALPPGCSPPAPWGERKGRDGNPGLQSLSDPVWPGPSQFPCSQNKHKQMLRCKTISNT